MRLVLEGMAIPLHAVESLYMSVVGTDGPSIVLFLSRHETKAHGNYSRHQTMEFVSRIDCSFVLFRVISDCLKFFVSTGGGTVDHQC